MASKHAVVADKEVDSPVGSLDDSPESKGVLHLKLLQRRQAVEEAERTRDGTTAPAPAPVPRAGHLHPLTTLHPPRPPWARPLPPALLEPSTPPAPAAPAAPAAPPCAPCSP